MRQVVILDLKQKQKVVVLSWAKEWHKWAPSILKELGFKNCVPLKPLMLCCSLEQRRCPIRQGHKSVYLRLNHVED